MLPHASRCTGLLDEIMAQTRFKPESESYDIARRCDSFISALLQSDDEAEPVDILAVNAMIADIDARMGHQMDLILHARNFRNWSHFCVR